MSHLGQQIAVPSAVPDADLCWQPLIASTGFDTSKPSLGLPSCCPCCHHCPCQGCQTHSVGTDGQGHIRDGLRWMPSR